MLRSFVWSLVLLVLVGGVTASADVLSELESLEKDAVGIADDLWSYAELGYQEQRSTDRLQKYLKRKGFKIETGIAGIPTAFTASFGSGEPVIGILAEFDALPGLSQAAEPARNPLVENAPGHACGHHLFGAASTSAAVALSRWLKSERRSGTVRLYGTPAEEGGSGKVYMTRAGLFNDVDVVLHWHPGDVNDASPSTSTANKSGRFQFFGKAAHAASAPDQGRSALDGVEAMNYMVNMMREHVPQDSRIHYVITDGGDAPNIVPEFAEVYYYVRNPNPDLVVSLFDWVVKAAEGAAQGTDTRMEYEVMHGNYPVLPNESLAQLVHRNMLRVEGIKYSAKEEKFARTIRETLMGARVKLGSERAVQPFQPRQGMGSTDVGDVSWNVPTVGFSTATWVPGTPAHSWQAVATGGMSIGHQGMLYAARVLATTGAELFSNVGLIDDARAELDRRQGPGFVYAPLLGDRLPPLDYRK